MLKLKNIIWLAALVVTISSCDDYLDTPPVDKITSDGFYQTQAQSEQGILGIYADLRQASNCMYWFMSECRSDVAWVEPNPDAFREYSEIGTFRATDDMRCLMILGICGIRSFMMPMSLFLRFRVHLLIPSLSEINF